MAGAATVLEEAFLELRDQREFYDQVVRELYSRGLMTTEDLHTTVTAPSMVAKRTTPLGASFVAFITSPLNE